MNIRVRLFAGMRERAGRSEIPVVLPDATDITGLKEQLAVDYPALTLDKQRFTVTVNRSFAKPDQILHDGDEVALIPPVSGGSAAASAKLFEIVEGPISLDDVASRVLAPERGGITVFAGTVRGVTRDAFTGEQRTDYLEYEAYPEMAEASFASIAGEAQSRWPDIGAVAVLHRVGRLEIGDVSIVIAVAAGHRANTFDACHYIIDRIKQVSPIWKKEVGPDGAIWVEGPESRV
jgi:molybdopterin converting factor subunit 1